MALQFSNFRLAFVFENKQTQSLKRVMLKVSIHMVSTVIFTGTVVLPFLWLQTFYKMWSHNIPKRHKRPWSHQLQRSATEHSSTCHCIRFLLNLLNVLVQIANKMGLQKKNLCASVYHNGIAINLLLHVVQTGSGDPSNLLIQWVCGGKAVGAGTCPLPPPPT
jgi:hypothetical protein